MSAQAGPAKTAGALFAPARAMPGLQPRRSSGDAVPQCRQIGIAVGLPNAASAKLATKCCLIDAAAGYHACQHNRNCCSRNFKPIRRDVQLQPCAVSLCQHNLLPRLAQARAMARQWYKCRLNLLPFLLLLPVVLPRSVTPASATLQVCVADPELSSSCQQRCSSVPHAELRLFISRLVWAWQ